MTHHQHESPRETYGREQSGQYGQQSGQMGDIHGGQMTGMQSEQAGGMQGGATTGQYETGGQFEAGGQYEPTGGGQEMMGSPQGAMGGQQEMMSGQQEMMGGTSSGQPTTRANMRLAPDAKGALTNIARAIEVCEWCADQCVQEANPSMVECIRLCEDVSELGRTVLALAPRRSRHGRQAVQVFEQAVRACAEECGRHQQSHCQECAQTLGQTLQEMQSLLRSMDEQGGQPA